MTAVRRGPMDGKVQGLDWSVLRSVAEMEGLNLGPEGVSLLRSCELGMLEGQHGGTSGAESRGNKN